MPLPALYKYLDVQGAKLTLGNRTFKHSKPSDFNDTEDLTIQSIFPEGTEAALARLEREFTGVILAHLNDPPTCASPMREMIALIQRAYRANPDLAAIVEAELANEGPVFGVAYMRARSEGFIGEINEFMQGYRVLCASMFRDSDKIWQIYSENHKGIALRIAPNVAKDSKFQLFRPVVYREGRPPLYDDTLEFTAGSLFGDQMARLRTIVDKIIYSKTLHWEYEGEFRLAVPLSPGEEPWDTLKYHAEEVSELYLGARMTEADREEIIATAKSLNPEIRMFQAKRNEEGEVSFEALMVQD